MELEPAKFKHLLPLPVTLITTCDIRGRINAAPYSSIMPVLRPLDLIAFASNPSHDTLRNIRETGHFVVNIIGRPSYRRAMRCAKEYPFGVNELDEIGLDTIPSNVVDPPRVREAVGWIEAKKVEEVSGKNYVLLVGKVLVAEMNDRYMKGKDLDELPMTLLFPYFRALGEPLARRDDFNVKSTKRRDDF
jgi:flavin reductase (DIM6/NTAB) family NADH-FMN oxidoreductase RutF